MSRRAPLLGLLAADAVSISGNAVARIAIPWFVLDETGSATLTGLTAVFGLVPVILSGFFGGALVDRLGFRRTSIAADLASAATVAAIPLLALTGVLEVWHVMVLVFLGALCDAPGTTARGALLPDLAALTGVRLERATGLQGGVARGAFLVGAPLGGVLVATAGSTTALWLDAASFLVSAGLVARLVPSVRPHTFGEEPGSYLAQLVEGLRFVATDRLLRAIVATVLLTNFLDGPLAPVIYPVLARESFGGAEQLGLMLGTMGGAGLLGSLAFSAVGHRLPRRWTFVGCFFGVALGLVGVASAPPFALVLAFLALGGFCSGPLNPVLYAAECDRVPPRLRGRVFGAITAGAWAAIPLGMLLGGVCVDAFGAGATLAGVALAYVAVTGYGFFNAAFREMDAPAVPAAVGRAA